MSAFHGKPATAKPVRALRTFWISNGTGTERTVTAHYVNWGTGHVLFWEDRPDGVPDHLVLAVVNGDARLIEERAPEPACKLVKRPATLDEDLHALDDGGR